MSTKKNGRLRFDSLTAQDFLGNVDEENSDEKSDEGIILQLVKSHPDGISVRDLADYLEVTPKTILKKLRALEAEREIYSKKISNATYWFPNGRLIHPYLEFFRELRGKPYRFTIQEGRSGPLVQIQERSFSLLFGEKVEGAIFIELGLVDDLIDSLQDLKNRYADYEKKIEVKI
jgi:hypothetical protein